MSIVGEAITRVDGKLKVTGAAKYSAEFQVPNVAYGVMVLSTIPSGKIASMDVSRAQRVPGVIAVLNSSNALKLPQGGKAGVHPPAGRVLSLLQDDEVHYNRQPIALVVAESLYAGHYASSLIRVRYEPTAAKLDFMADINDSHPGHHGKDPGREDRGDMAAGMSQAEVTVDEIYTTPIETHVPMEPHATIAAWDGDHLTLHDATQYVSGVQSTVAKTLGIPEDNVRVICPFVGGGFGCKGSTWSHVLLAAMAAKQVNRPVKIALERPQMFGPVGARPQTYQHIVLGATRDGKLTATRHDVHCHTSVIEDFLEPSAVATRILYACPNLTTSHLVVPLNLGTPTFQRAPGEATGTYALEVAMDELAYKLNMDPLQLRLVNYAEEDPQSRKPFSGKHLRECYAQGAEKFGWSRRNHEPRSMRDGNQLIGWGVATATYPGNRAPASALVRLQPDGRVTVASGTQDLGTGTYTIMTQVAADGLGISPDLIDVKLGDTNLPKAPVSGGSMSAASVTPAVKAAAAQARLKILTMASADLQSPVHGAATEDLDFKDGKIFRKSSPDQSETFVAVLARNGNKPVEATAEAQSAEDAHRFSAHSFGAVFAEVSVDPDLGIVRVRKVVGVYDVGKLLNKKTGASQFIGGIVWGISLALFEDAVVDPHTGRIVNANLAEYHVPVNADIGEIDVSVIDIPDMNFNPLGARGIGEIGITGVGGAVANAIYHATGKRIRELPITPDKLMA
ncbi:MAG: xanthine dehydrogenase family protein molybdopterin-binding subunit [Terriglobales bacterium]